MASPRVAWGIDIGNRALKAVKLVRDGDILRVDDFDIVEHETVLSNAGDNRESLIQTALAHFLQRHPVKKTAIAVGVSSQNSFARFIKLPPVESKKIPEIVRFEAIQQIPFPLDEVEWSYQLFQTPDSPDVEVGIFAMRKELINNHIKYLTDVKLNVQVVQMNPLAVYNALVRDDRISGTTMILDLGAESTDLIIADATSVWLRSIPVGGNNFTDTLVKAFKLPFAKAEELKRNAASSKYARQIFQAMRPVFADLVAEVQRSVGFYASVHRDSRIKKIIALGGTFRMPALQKYLQQNLQLDVEGLDTLGGAAPPDGKTATLFSENLRSAAVAYGLAVQALGDGRISSSLLPTAIRREKMWKEKVPWFALAASLFVAGTVVMIGRNYFDNYQFSSGETQRTEADNVARQAADLDQQWQKIQDSGVSDRTQIANVRSLAEYRTLWPDLLMAIYNATPKDDEKGIPRGQRKQVLFDSIYSSYRPVDYSSIVTGPEFRQAASLVPIPNMDTAQGGGMPQMGGGMPGGFNTNQPNGAAAPPDKAYLARAPANSRGFLLVLRCVSPNSDATSLVEQDFLQKGLLSVWPTAAQPHMEFGIARAEIVTRQQIRNDPDQLNRLRAAYEQAVAAQQAAAQPGQPAPRYGGGGGQDESVGSPGAGSPYGGGYGGNPAANMTDENSPAFKDANGESVLDDWEFTILVAVTLDPPPPGQTPGQAPTPGPAAPHNNNDEAMIINVPARLRLGQG
jgi:type IV pilus assembly protein PilM